MSLDGILVWLGLRKRGYATPDRVKLKGKNAQVHRQKVRDAYWDALARLQAKGKCKPPRHKVEEIEFRPGTYSEPGKDGWAVWDPANKMYIAGYYACGKIMIVVDPETGALAPKRGYADIRHEWGHGLLDGTGDGKLPWQKQHEIMGF